MKTLLEGKAFVYGKNVDTDQIYPAPLLTITDADKVGQHAMEGVDPDFVRECRPGDVIVASPNFGCGSSREHAAWAIAGYGVRVVISSFFADIHKNNELNNFVLPVVVSEDFLQELFRSIAADPKTEVEVNLPEQKVTNKATGRCETFEINAYKKHCLMNGLDDIDFLVENKDKIAEFENRRAGL